MSIQVTCKNIVRWDSHQKKYVTCGQKIAASDKMAGTFVPCPKCGSQLEIPQPDEPNELSSFQDDDPFATDAALASKKPEPSRPMPQPKIKEPADHQDTIDDFQQASIGEDSSSPETEDEYTINSADGGWGLTAAPSQPLADTPSSLQMGRYCPGCGTAMEPDDILCGQCNYHTELGRRIVTSDQGRGEETEGAKRWFDSLLAEGESATGVIVLVAVFFVVAVVGVSTLLIYDIGARALFFIVPVLTVVGVIIAGVVAARRQRARLAEGQPPDRQNFVWHIVLWFFRLSRWREWRWPFRKRVLMKVEVPEFSDEDLKKMPGLEDCQVLDLQGTKVSDRGMPYLTGLPELRFVIVKKTRVTGAGAQLLQHASSDMWIWF